MATDTSRTYQGLANVRLDFYDTAEATTEGGDGGKATSVGIDESKTYHKLCGFLTDDGLSLNLINKFDPALDLIGGFLEQAGGTIASIKALAGGIAGVGATGYITSSIGDTNIILNSPMMWKGTDPIRFTVSLFQIADYENEIIQNYQRILEILSPGTEAGPKIVDLSGKGPGLVKVHYFPVNTNDGKTNPIFGTGNIVFGPCLCTSVSMEIKPPYSSKYQPILGSYKFDLVTSKILDRSEMARIFSKQPTTIGKYDDWTKQEMT